MIKKVICIVCIFVIISTCLAQTGTGTKAKKNYEYLGRLSANKYDPESISNPYGKYGNPYGNTINNPYSTYGSPYSSKSIKNPYSSFSSPILIDEYGKYLSKLNSNKYDPDSVSYPYGRYGSPYSPDSINNPYGKYGSPYFPLSVPNPYTTRAPKIYAPTNSSTIILPEIKNDFFKLADKK